MKFRATDLIFGLLVLKFDEESGKKYYIWFIWRNLGFDVENLRGGVGGGVLCGGHRTLNCHFHGLVSMDFDNSWTTSVS